MRRILRVLFPIAIVAALLAPALIGNYQFAQRYLLRVDRPADPFSDIPKRMFPVGRPLVLAAGGGGQDDAIRRRFSAAAGIAGRALPDTADPLIDISTVTKVNPNPQPWDVLLARGVNYLSYGYVGTDNRYHQVTYYWGESDSTPSPLVRKVRGSETGHGDYLVRYTVYLSRDLGAHRAPFPNIDRIDWSTYKGGSYNGAEELGFAIYATAGEGVLLFALVRRRRRRR